MEKEKPIGQNGFVKKTEKSQLKWYNGDRNNEARKHYNEIVDIARENNPNFKMSDNISRYGDTDIREFFAEVFANS